MLFFLLQKEGGEEKDKELIDRFAPISNRIGRFLFVPFAFFFAGPNQKEASDFVNEAK